MRTCATCRHARTAAADALAWTCKRTAVQYRSPLTGRRTTAGEATCSAARRSTGCCGLGGRHWERRQTDKT
jgi:hypothetical protein